MKKLKILVFAALAVAFISCGTKSNVETIDTVSVDSIEVMNDTIQAIDTTSVCDSINLQ